MEITKSIKYVGVNDNDIDLFESQYRVPNGISYNSYLIKDEKTALLDTVDLSKYDEWKKILEGELLGSNLDFLVLHHIEPDHAGSISKILEMFPNVTIVGNVKTFSMLKQFYNNKMDNILVVKEGDFLDLGKHKLNFVMAPMVHWPEVMVSYESCEKVLFSADAFGKFGVPDLEDEWEEEARRYYFNIVGKYGNPVQTLLKKVAKFEIEKICSLHGPVLNDNIQHYISLYDTWSSYTPESDGVFIAFASIYSNTKKVAFNLYEKLKSEGVQVEIADVARTDLSFCVSKAFQYSKIVLASSSYDGGVFLPMADFIARLQKKTFQNRTVGLIENGSWAPCSARAMKKEFEDMKNIKFCENIVSVKSSFKSEDEEQLNNLFKELISN